MAGRSSSSVYSSASIPSTRLPRRPILPAIKSGLATTVNTGLGAAAASYNYVSDKAIVPAYKATSNKLKSGFYEWNNSAHELNDNEKSKILRKTGKGSQRTWQQLTWFVSGHIEHLIDTYYNNYPVIHTGRGRTILSTAEPTPITDGVERALLKIRKDVSLDERFQLIKTAIERSQNHKDYQSIIGMLMKYPDVVNHTMETVLDGKVTQETLLMTAANHNKTRVIYKLLSMGANANLKNAEGKTAIMLLNPEGEDFIKALRCMISYADAFGKDKLDLGELPLKYLHAWKMHPKHQVVLEDDSKILEKTLEQAQKTRREHQKTLSAPAIKPSPHRTLPLFEPAPPYSALPPPGSAPPAYSRLPIS